MVEKYFCIMVTVLVLTQIVRIVQNAKRLSEYGKIIENQTKSIEVIENELGCMLGCEGCKREHDYDEICDECARYCDDYYEEADE